MNTAPLHSCLKLGVLGILLLFTACGDRKCQDPVTERFQTFVEQEWRMVDTNNPNIAQTLSNTTFLIIQFNRDFTGALFKVENNVRFDDPVLFIEYNVDPEARLIIADFTTETPVEGGNGDEVQSESAGDARYLYELGRDFVLNETQTGFFYRFVPFLGIIDPDLLCSFP